MSYISPITVNFVDEIVETIQKDQETAVMTRVKMIVDVDREELLQALRYDRGQYEKGYADGKADRRKGRWEDFSCSLCGFTPLIKPMAIDTTKGLIKCIYKYCPACGAEMRGEE